MTLRTKFIVIVACIIAFIAGCAVNQLTPVRFGWPAWKGPMVSEFKVLHANLESQDLSPQLREFLKSRLYYIAGSLDPADLAGFHFDYGPINEQVLGRAQGNKGPETQAELYAMAMARHPGQRKSKQ
jgi:hypothetical protein